MARSRRPEREEPGGEGAGGGGGHGAGAGEGVGDGREDNEDEAAGGAGTITPPGRRKENQGSRGAAGLRAILKEEGGRGGGKEGVKMGRGRSSRLGRRGGSKDVGKAYRPGSEMTQRSKEKKGRGGGGGSRDDTGDGQRGAKRVSYSQSLSGSHSSLGRGGEDSLMAGEDLLMVRRYRTRGRSLGPGTGNRVNKYKSIEDACSTVDISTVFNHLSVSTCFYRFYPVISVLSVFLLLFYLFQTATSSMST